MTKVVPFVQQCKELDVDIKMHQLAEIAGVDVKQLLELLSLHLNESPRLMMLPLRLSMVVKLLKETELSKEEISDELGFTSTNYMIASFFHRYRMTPDDYRKSMAL